MKKVFLAILTLLYISASIGVTLHTHYCMDILAARGNSHCKSQKCDKCGSEKINKKDNLCCRNENKFVKNDKDQNIPESVFHLTPSIAVALPPYFLELSFNQFASTSEVIPINDALPPISGIAIYVRNCVFLI
jgi:hypothetical protein